MKILVADDHASGRQVIMDIIAAMGHEVVAAEDGPSALLQARLEMPDLVILDVEMPGLSGFEVCKLLRAEEATSRMSIIMLTALHETEDRVRGLNIGADDYLIKPFAVKELMARIEKRLEAKREADALRDRQAVIRQVFERYVPPHVVERLLQDPSLVKLGGEMQEVTVLFADLEGFTRMSEHMHPEKLLSILNHYHDLVVNLVLQHHGTVNKFIGDGVMALFNTPLPDPRHAGQAVGAALAIRDALTEFHRQFEPAHRLPINFGLHTGPAVVGNVGTAQIMDFTAVGDTVNLAARLREHAHGGQILISDKTHAQLAGRAEVRIVGPQQVKNRSEPVMTYEVLQWR
ncbi:MAG: adenylate/guanylate cyclase domain-containing protein [bacterium]|nr:adenylate/guanylate cyclase domain-containing protein [bacterium]MDI1336743.1 adenylate/guanylate cyclase domain-containing protein [Lacunisphaera sp.]